MMNPFDPSGSNDPQEEGRVSTVWGVKMQRYHDVLGLSNREISEMLTVPFHTCLEWAAGVSEPVERLRERFAAVDRLIMILEEKFENPVQMRGWLRIENPFFNGRQPLNAFRRGDFATLETALNNLDNDLAVY